MDDFIEVGVPNEHYVLSQLSKEGSKELYTPLASTLILLIPSW